MTERGTVSRQMERGLYAVILATPVIPAIGWDDWGDGNPEERRQPPVGHLQQDGSSLPVTLGVGTGASVASGG